nr:Wzz/FepE/Etk N-terminal domain-containing protein [Pseudomonadota bacterium]
MHDIIDQFFSYLRGVWRHRWYALLVAWLVCLGGWALVYKLPDQYQASAQVYVDTQTMLRPLLKGLAVDINPDSQIVLMTQTLLSRPNLEKVTRMTDLDLKARDSNAMDALVADLAGRISLQAAGRVNLYNISFTDHDPQLAKRVVQALLTI